MATYTNKAGYQITIEPLAPHSILDDNGGSVGGTGTTFTPHIQATTDGFILSWTNDGGLTNPDPVTIKNGAAGATGPAGEAGPQGEAGEAATITVGTVTTGEAGSAAAVVNSGTVSAAVLDFTIPRGEKGEAGGGSSLPTGADGQTLVYNGTAGEWQASDALTQIDETLSDISTKQTEAAEKYGFKYYDMFGAGTSFQVTPYYTTGSFLPYGITWSTARPVTISITIDGTEYTYTQILQFTRGTQVTDCKGLIPFGDSDGYILFLYYTGERTYATVRGVLYPANITVSACSISGGSTVYTYGRSRKTNGAAYSLQTSWTKITGVTYDYMPTEDADAITLYTPLNISPEIHTGAATSYRVPLNFTDTSGSGDNFPDGWLGVTITAIADDGTITGKYWTEQHGSGIIKNVALIYAT